MATPSEINGWDMVVFLPGTWEGSFPRHLLQACARRMRGHGNVFCVERPRCPWVSLWKLLRSLWKRDSFGQLGRRSTGDNRQKKFRGFTRQSLGLPYYRPLQENLAIVSPWVLLHNLIAEYIPGLPFLNKKLLQWQLRRVFGQARKAGQRQVVWLFHPFQLEDADLWRGDLLLYACYDRYDEPPQVITDSMRGRMRSREKLLLDKADLVLTVSRPLQTLKASQGYFSHWVPNAADPKFFGKAGHSALKVPDDLLRIPSPRLGFIGEMSERIDFELLDLLAERRPKDSLVLIGGITGELQARKLAALKRLQDRPNVFLLGRRPYDTLPNYMKGFDVCVVPYDESEFNRCSSPLKIYEYLASGKPIVSVATPEIEAFSDVVSVVHERTAFPEAVEQELKWAGDLKRRQKRLERAYQNTWDARAATIFDLIQSRDPRSSAAAVVEPELCAL